MERTVGAGGRGVTGRSHRHRALLPPALARAALALALLFALAGPVSASTEAPDATADGDPLRVDPLATTAEMRAFIHQRVPDTSRPSDRLSALMDAVFAKGHKGLGVVYGSRETRTAAETFARRSGNCISFANLLVALAREIGLNAYFAEVDEVLARDQRGEALINNRHMLIEVEIENAVFEVDLLPDADSYHDVRRISDRRAAAHYFNNLGVDRLIEEGAAAALPWFERSIELAPDFAAAWVNLGVTLRRRGRFADAERAYRRAIEIDRSELAAFSNLAYLYRAWGREAEADALPDRVARYRRHNPFRAFQRGRAAVEAGDLELAIESFREAVRRDPEEARFHFALGDALYRSGELDKARQSLEKALKLAGSDSEREHYRSALEALETLLAVGPPPAPPATAAAGAGGG